MPVGPNNSHNQHQRGRFLLGRAGSSLRRTQKIAKAASAHGRMGTQLSPVKENVPNRPTADENFPVRIEPQNQLPIKSSPHKPHGFRDVINGFSKAELHDLEESFKLFDIYGEGSVQVGDLRNILEVLRQEQMQQQESSVRSKVTKFPHLDTLLYRLTEATDEDTLDLENYMQLMASTTISNSIALEQNGFEGDGDDHFARVFNLFDADNKGYIDVEDLHRIAMELGEQDMTKAELEEMIERASGDETNESGNSEKVGLNEFRKIMTMSIFPSNNTGE